MNVHGGPLLLDLLWRPALPICPPMHLLLLGELLDVFMAIPAYVRQYARALHAHFLTLASGVASGVGCLS